MDFDVNGKRVFATSGGRPFDNGKPAVLFLGGSGLDHTFWGLHSRFFAFRNYAVAVPDRPGHSGSVGPCLTSIEAIADWYNDVIEVLQMHDISLVAHSQGCLEALELASRYPQNIRSVSFIASGLATPVNAALLEAAEHEPESAVAMMVSWGFGRAGHHHHGAIPGSSMLGNARKVMLRNAPVALAADLHACNAYMNGREAAAAIRCPQQVLLADKDRMAPRAAVMQLVESLPDARLTVVADCGHMLPLENPDECRSLLRDFIFANNPASTPR